MRTISVIFLASLILTGTTCAAIVTNVDLVKSYNLSVDLGSAFNVTLNIITRTSGSGNPEQIINITDPKNRNATLTIFPVFMKPDLAKMEKLSALMDTTIVSMLNLIGYTEVGKQSVITSDGQNVTIHKSNSAEGETIYFATWNIDELNQITVSSSLDQNNTTQIVKSLKIVP